MIVKFKLSQLKYSNPDSIYLYRASECLCKFNLFIYAVFSLLETLIKSLDFSAQLSRELESFLTCLSLFIFKCNFALFLAFFV